jgi:hypothetical protein
LVAERRLTDGQIMEHLTSTFNSLPGPGHGARTCPGRGRSPFVVLFAYAHRSPVAVTVNIPNTCFLVSNGHDVKSAEAAPPDHLLSDVLHGGP